VTFNHAPYFGPALSSFTQPSETILAAELNDQVTEDHFMPMFWGDPAKLEDVDKQAEQWDPVAGQPLALVLTRHAIGSNYPFADGHSKHMKFGQIWHQTTGSVADKDWFDPLR
jgi:hypothetical protein